MWADSKASWSGPAGGELHGGGRAWDEHRKESSTLTLSWTAPPPPSPPTLGSYAPSEVLEVLNSGTAMVLFTDYAGDGGFELPLAYLKPPPGKKLSKAEELKRAREAKVKADRAAKEDGKKSKKKEKSDGGGGGAPAASPPSPARRTKSASEKVTKEGKVEKRKRCTSVPGTTWGVVGIICEVSCLRTVGRWWVGAT